MFIVTYENKNKKKKTFNEVSASVSYLDGIMKTFRAEKLKYFSLISWK